MTPLEIIEKMGEILFGNANKLLFLLIALVIIDYVTGVCLAIHTKKISSKIGAKGITKKIVIFALVALSHILDEYVLNSSDTIMTVTTAFYASNECMSIFENVGQMGIPLPQKLKDILTYFDELGKKK